MPIGLRSGPLNRRLRIQSVAMTPDAEGTSAEAWTTLATVWAAISPAGGRELPQAGQTEERITHQVTIRYRTDVAPKMRLLLGASRIFNVHSAIDPDESHVELDLLCEEVVTTGTGQY